MIGKRVPSVFVALLAVALAANLAAATTVSVGLATDVAKPNDLQLKLVDATKARFTEKGYKVVNTGGDYQVTTNITDVSSDKKFSPLGCLACGIWGAAKPKATGTVSTRIVTASGKEVFVNSVKATAEGDELFGIFKESGKQKLRVIDEALKQLYTAFFLQHPPSTATARR